jgi:SAM-dependent methyltransferase
MLKSLASWFNRSDQSRQAKAIPVAELINSFYTLFFDRPADQAAIDHWSEYLVKGMTPLDFFRVLWRSEEFASKSQQSPYIRAPRAAGEVEETQQSIITPEFFTELIALLEKDKTRLLEVRQVRAAVAQWRYRDLMQAGQVKTVESSDLAVPDTIPYNEFTLRSYVSDDRPMHLVRPLVTIGRVAENVADLKLLSIGGRTEMELFALLAGGFSLSNITMIDLFSYSPYVQVGDMHKMDFSDNAFDVIVFGDVLSYSREPGIAVREIIRVAKNKAIISAANGCTKGYTPLWEKSTGDRSTEGFTGISVQSTDDILRLFAGHVGRIYARYEPEAEQTPQLNRVLTVFEILK